MRTPLTPPAATLCPLLSRQELDNLIVGIRKHGQRKPIFLDKDKILAGRNHYRACVALREKESDIIHSFAKRV